jgi:uncharacterized membrane protein
MLKRIKSWKSTIVGLVLIIASIAGWDTVHDQAGTVFDLVMTIVTSISGLFSIFGIKE